MNQNISFSYFRIHKSPHIWLQTHKIYAIFVLKIFEITFQ